MRITRDESSSLGRGEGHEEVVAWIRRPRRRRLGGIGRELGQVADHLEESSSILGSDPLAQLCGAEGSIELRQKQLGDDELEIAVEPALQQASRCSAA